MTMTTTGQLGTPQSRPGSIELGGLMWPPLGTPTANGKLAACMDGLATLIATGAPLGNVFPCPVKSMTPPAVVVGYPTSFVFDTTMARGADEMVYPVWFVVGDSSTTQARNALSDILSDAGGVKALLDGTHAFGAFSVDVRVTDASITELTVAGVAYLAARFDCEVYG